MKEKILCILKQRGTYVSGQELADELGVSRTAVWKAIAALKKQGYAVEASGRLGYRLDSARDILNANEIDFTDDFYFIDETSSTSELAKKFALEGKGDFFFVISNRQTAGRGRLGRTWISPYGVNIYLSMVFHPDIDIAEVPQITPVIGLAAAKTLIAHTGLDVKIKWPNDVLINGKKAVGILAEMQAEAERIIYIVAGIGINVNQQTFDAEIADKATSLFIETGREYRRSDIIKTLFEEIKRLYPRFVKDGFAAFADEYKALCINIGRDVRAVYRGREVIGRAVDISRTGELIIETENGLVSVSSGEATLRNANNNYI